MKIKTSVTLSGELVKAIAKYRTAYSNRSGFIEAAIWAYIDQIVSERQSARDVEMINRMADLLNAEAEDILSYQVPL